MTASSTGSRKKREGGRDKPLVAANEDSDEPGHLRSREDRGLAGKVQQFMFEIRIVRRGGCGTAHNDHKPAGQKLGTMQADNLAEPAPHPFANHRVADLARGDDAEARRLDTAPGVCLRFPEHTEHEIFSRSGTALPANPAIFRGPGDSGRAGKSELHTVPDGRVRRFDRRRGSVPEDNQAWVCRAKWTSTPLGRRRLRPR